MLPMPVDDEKPPMSTDIEVTGPGHIDPCGVYYLGDVARVFHRDERTVERWNLPWSRLGDRTRVILGSTLMRHLEKLAGE